MPLDSDDFPALMTRPEAAAALHISRGTLDNLRRAGLLRPVRPSPGKLFYAREDIVARLARQPAPEREAAARA